MTDKAQACQFTLRYYLPDEVSRGKAVELSISVPHGFARSDDDPNSYIGSCDDDPFEVHWTTPVYDRTWVGELDVEAIIYVS